MNIKDNFRLIFPLSNIFTIKEGKIVIDKEGKCYKTADWVSWIFKIYYYSGLIFIVFVFLFLLMPHFANSLWGRLIETTVLYFLLELLLFLLIPIRRAKCWERELQKQNK